MTKSQLNEKIRAAYLPRIAELFAVENDVCTIASNKIAIPVLDEEGNEKWLTITVSVPTDPEFDGYTDAEVYREKVAAREKKAQERAAAAQERQEKAAARKAAKEAKEAKED